MKNKKKPHLKEYTYRVTGMHCPSCEVLIEKRLIEEKTIEAVEASANKNEVRMAYTGKKPTQEILNRMFQKDGYHFAKKLPEVAVLPLFQFNQQGQFVINKTKLVEFLTVGGISLLIIIGFIFLNRSGLSALISVNSQSALPAFLIFGLLAGFSTCSALIGGLILSMSKQWLQIYGRTTSNWQKFQPHLLFNSGRLLSFGLLGGLLGLVGSALQIAPLYTATLTIGVAVMMFFLGLQMVGLRVFRRFQFTMPKFVTRWVADEKNFKGRFMPLLMGFLTFFLPCGFTITSQGLALTAGRPLQAGLIMFFFALGTLPALLLIGLTSLKFSERPHFANQFMRVAGVLVLFFAFYNFNSQLNVLGLKSLSDFSFGLAGPVNSKEGFPPVANGKQILKMDALAYGYQPNQLKVKAGIPVRWEITDKGSSGCTNAIVSRGLFSGQIDLTPGKVSVKEFVPQKPGKYKFSCWMGMVSGLIEVVDSTVGSVEAAEEIPSGAQGCGGIGGSGCTGGCRGGCGSPGCPYAQ